MIAERFAENNQLTRASIEAASTSRIAPNQFLITAAQVLITT